MIHAIERGQHEGRKPIQWKLITNLPVKCKADAIALTNCLATYLSGKQVYGVK